VPKMKDNPYVICGHKDRHHLVNIDKAWRRVRLAAGITDVRLHDLRRTVGSWLVQSGNSLPLIGRVLNHSNTSTTQIYARFAEDKVRTALDDHGKKLVAIAGGTLSI
jgi:integrase